MFKIGIKIKLIIVYILAFMLFMCFLLSVPIVAPLVKGTWYQPLYTYGMPVIALTLTNILINRGYSIINKASKGGEADKVVSKIY